MKQWIFLVLLVLGANGYAQSLHEKMQGTWVCVSISDTLGNKANGEFGGTSNYLKFKIEEKRLFIALAPFDLGLSIKINFGNDYFELLNAPLSQTRYVILSNDGNDMILRTVNREQQKIYYHFVNQNTFTQDLQILSAYREVEKIILGITYLTYFDVYSLKCYYSIDNSILNQIPSPQFGNRREFSLGNYFESNLQLPHPINKEILSKDFDVEFDVTKYGIENIRILKPLGPELDIQMINMLRATSEKWQPLIVNGQAVVTRMKLTFSFTYKEQ